MRTTACRQVRMPPSMAPSEGAAPARAVTGGLLPRLFNRDVGLMLARNTLVSTLVFAIGLLVLWLLVEQVHLSPVLSAGVSFVVANTLHYAAGRSWIFRGTQRKVATGYAYFLVNSGLGLIVTILLFAALMRWTNIHYMAARILISLFAGLMMFLLNAFLNFQRA